MYDADGNRTTNPALAARGEVVELAADGSCVRSLDGLAWGALRTATGDDRRRVAWPNVFASRRWHRAGGGRRRTASPDLRELIGEDVPVEEQARLRPVHELLLAAAGREAEGSGSPRWPHLRSLLRRAGVRLRGVGDSRLVPIGWGLSRGKPVASDRAARTWRHDVPAAGTGRPRPSTAAGVRIRSSTAVAVGATESARRLRIAVPGEKAGLALVEEIKQLHAELAPDVSGSCCTVVVELPENDQAERAAARVLTALEHWLAASGVAATRVEFAGRSFTVRASADNPDRRPSVGDRPAA